MKVFLLGLLVALANATPLPLDEEIGEPVELIVNGVPEGEPLEIGDIVGIKLKTHVDGQLASSSDLLHPLTAQGLAEAAAAAESNPGIEDEIFPVLPAPIPELTPVEPEVIPELAPELSPEQVQPEVLPEPESPEPSLPEDNVPGPIVIPMPIVPEVEAEPEVIEEPASQIPNGEIFNDGNVQVLLNGPEQPGVLSTLQNWVQMFLNYFSNGVQTTQQII